MYKLTRKRGVLGKKQIPILIIPPKKARRVVPKNRLVGKDPSTESESLLAPL